ncbi:MAG: hypothetical protein SGARI_002123 [Bacillariaceae sp.]
MQNYNYPKYCDVRDLNLIKEGYAWSQRFRTEYGIPHFLLGPPKQISAGNTSEQIQALNAAISAFDVSTYSGEKKADFFYTKPYRKTTWDEFYVQPVHKADPYNIFFKCSKSGNHWSQSIEARKRFVQEVNRRIVEQQPQPHLLFQGHLQQQREVFNADIFARRIRRYTTKIIQAATQQEWLFRDFQFYIDPSAR